MPTVAFGSGVEFIVSDDHPGLVKFIPLSVGRIGSHMSRDVGLLALLSCDDALSCERIDQILEGSRLSFAIETADGIFKHGARYDDSNHPTFPAGPFRRLRAR
jgi:hypothetical protein